MVTWMAFICGRERFFIFKTCPVCCPIAAFPFLVFRRSPSLLIHGDLLWHLHELLPFYTNIHQWPAELTITSLAEINLKFLLYYVILILVYFKNQSGVFFFFWGLWIKYMYLNYFCSVPSSWAYFTYPSLFNCISL